MAEQKTPAQRSKREQTLFSVVGWKPEGRTVALIIANSEADAEYYALHELGFVQLESTSLVSDSVHVGPSDTEALDRW
jgi:hypothetical protein